MLFSSVVRAAPSHRLLRPLFSRQNPLQRFSAFRKMAGERRRGDLSWNSRGRRPPSVDNSPHPHKSASPKFNMCQEDEHSSTNYVEKDDGHGRFYIHRSQHERLLGGRTVGERGLDRYSGSRARHSPSAHDSRNSCESPLIPRGSRSQRVRPSCRSVGVVDNNSRTSPRCDGQSQDSLFDDNASEHVERGDEADSKDGPPLAPKDNTGSHMGGWQHEQVSGNGNTSGSRIEHPERVVLFDICPKRATGTPKLNPSLFSQNKEKRKEAKLDKMGLSVDELRSGMILLKNYLGVTEQVEIVEECHRLSLGPGGFYQPGYRDGAKLHLQMMCLGKNWDPETGLYGEKRTIDDAKPPCIPDRFKTMVQRALQDSHDFLKKKAKSVSVEEVLPKIEPDICIVNFYTNTGKLGLHQDRDESHESRKKGLPVVSFSIGDAAEFSYGDVRDATKAEKIMLESGDVLIFGGKSRHIFHGVSSILPATAPKFILREANLRPGRLNLTFRQF